jgi:hypothetical protein
MKSLWRKTKSGKWYKLKPPTDKVKYIACDETSQTNYYSRTNKKSSYIDRNLQK